MRLPPPPNTGNQALDKWVRQVTQILEKVPQIYYEKGDFTSDGGQTGKPLKSDARGKVASTLIESSDVTHDSTTGIKGGSGSSILHLTQSQHDSLTDGNDCTIHIHDSRYYREDEYVATSTGTPDAGKPVKTDTNGILDDTLLATGTPSTTTFLRGDQTWVAPVHAETTGLQGGTSAQYYHLTSAQHSKLTTAQAFVADPSGGGTQDAEARTAIASALDILIAAGLMAAS